LATTPVVRRYGKLLLEYATMLYRRTEGEHEMGDKSPRKTNSKKPAKSMKEKRAAKHQKRREATELGRSSGLGN
jgi:hypothetical protein